MIVELIRKGKLITDTEKIDEPPIYAGAVLSHEFVVRTGLYGGEVPCVSFVESDTGKRITKSKTLFKRLYNQEDGNAAYEYYMPFPNSVVKNNGNRRASVFILDEYVPIETEDTYGNKARVITSANFDFTVYPNDIDLDFEPIDAPDIELLQNQMYGTIERVDGLETRLDLSEGNVDALLQPPDYVNDGGEPSVEIGDEGNFVFKNIKSEDGKSAYEVWLAEGNTGTVADYLANLKGKEGMSAYEVWLAEGNTGTLADYLESIKGRDGAPGANASGGTDMGSKIIPIVKTAWLFNGEEYVRAITTAEHGMAESPALLAFTAVYNDTLTELNRIDGFQSAGFDGTITLRSSYPWHGICIVAGGISQALDSTARELTANETERALSAESDLQTLISTEEARAKAAEAQTLSDAKDYTDEKIADTVAAAQTWLSSVSTFANLPVITDTTKTYLCRVTGENNVYQCVAGQTAWELYSENTDYVDEDELTEAIAVETNRATAAEGGLQTTINNEVSRAKAAEAQVLAESKEYTDNQLTLRIPPLYNAMGQMTDGAMTQKATTDAINAIAAGAFVPYTAAVTWSGSENNYSFNLPASTHGKGITPSVTTLQSGTYIDCAPYIDSAGNITIYSNANLSIIMEVR